MPKNASRNFLPHASSKTGQHSNELRIEGRFCLSEFQDTRNRIPPLLATCRHDKRN
jgi:hypothetical protein